MAKKKMQRWDDYKLPTEGLAVVHDKNNFCYGYIDMTGQEVIAPQWNGAEPFSDGKAAVMDDSYKKGYIDRTGKLVIACQWEEAGPFSEGRAAVGEGSEKALIDETGKVLTDYKYYKIEEFADSLAVVQPDWDVSGVIDRDGHEVIPSVHSQIRTFSDGRFAVKNEDGLWGYYDGTGRCVVPHKYEGAESYHCGLAFVKDDSGKWGVIDLDGNVVAPCQWNETNEEFKGGYAAVMDEKRFWGIIDKTGQLIESSKWWKIKLWNEEGLFASVQNDKKRWGAIDCNGKETLPCRWGSWFCISEGLLVVEDVDADPRSYQVIDPQGNVVIGPEKFRSADGSLLQPNSGFHDGLLQIQDYGTSKCGYMNSQGEIVIPCKWKTAWDFENGVAGVMKGKNTQLIDKNGNCL